MNHQTFEQLRNSLHEKALAIANAKRPGYTQGNPDVLRNFKAVASRIPGPAGQLTPGQAWSVYFLKHVDAVVTALSAPDLPQAEAVEGRFCDLLNYCDLGFGLFVEQEMSRKLREQSAQTSDPGSATPPRPGLVLRTQSPPLHPAESNILPWKQGRAGVEPPPGDSIHSHQSGHLSREARQESALALRLVEGAVEDTGIVDDGDRC
jgi:hypothetical protein